MKTEIQILAEVLETDECLLELSAHTRVSNCIKAMKIHSDQFINLIFIGKQKQLYKALFYEPSISTKAISALTGIESRNASTQLNNMCRTGLVGFQRVGKLKYWHRNF